jgi:hypothetical protein
MRRRLGYGRQAITSEVIDAASRAHWIPLSLDPLTNFGRSRLSECRPVRSYLGLRRSHFPHRTATSADAPGSGGIVTRNTEVSFGYVATPGTRMSVHH